MVDPKTPLLVKDLPPSCRVWIYGTGAAGRGLERFLAKSRQDVRVLGFLDSFRSGRLGPYRIERFPEFVPSLESYGLILIASGQSDGIVESLKAQGVQKYRVMVNEAPFLSASFPLSFKERYGDPLRKGLLTISPSWGERGRIVFFSGYGGLFAGNPKALALHLAQEWGIRPLWLASDPSLQASLPKMLAPLGIDVLPFPSLQALGQLLGARWLVLDNHDWRLKWPWLKDLPAPKLQLWHGVGFKRIERLRLGGVSLTEEEERRVACRFPRYDLLTVTSPFYREKVFGPAFNLPQERLPLTGYPRNDLFYRSFPGEDAGGDTEVLKRVDHHRREGGRVVVYAPTYREVRGMTDLSEALGGRETVDFLRQYRILLVMKAHAHPSFLTTLPGADQWMISYAPRGDVMPLLKRADLLVTDYSSLYTDFLHKGAPILFYPFDREEYGEAFREMQFPYDSMTPGPKAMTPLQLREGILSLLEGSDPWKERREELFSLAFTQRDGESSRRVAELLERP